MFPWKERRNNASGERKRRGCGVGGGCGATTPLFSHPVGDCLEQIRTNQEEEDASVCLWGGEEVFGDWSF